MSPNQTTLSHGKGKLTYSNVQKAVVWKKKRNQDTKLRSSIEFFPASWNVYVNFSLESTLSMTEQ